MVKETFAHDEICTATFATNPCNTVQCTIQYNKKMIFRLTNVNSYYFKINCKFSINELKNATESLWCIKNLASEPRIQYFYE